jgi:hypothetical protein
VSPVEILFFAIVIGVGIAVGRTSIEVLGMRPIGLGGLLALGAVLAQSGWLAQWDARPPHFFVFMTVTFAATVALAFSKLGARAADGVGWAGLIGFQVFRVPVEWVLHLLYLRGIVPSQMTFDGQNFDVLTGLTAPLFAWLAATGRIGARGILAWNVLGLLLLANIVTIAVLSTPTPLRMYAHDPANTFVTRLPWVWLPGFLVPAALLGHLLTFRKLARMR